MRKIIQNGSSGLFLIKIHEKEAKMAILYDFSHEFSCKRSQNDHFV